MENKLIDFILSECDYLTYDIHNKEHEYWYLFNYCTSEEEVKVQNAMKIIKEQIDILSDIQDDCYGR